MSEERRYAIGPDEGYFHAGIAQPNTSAARPTTLQQPAEQVLLGLACPNLVAFFFAADGQLLRTEQRPVPFFRDAEPPYNIYDQRLPPLLEAHRHLVERLTGDPAQHMAVRGRDLPPVVLALQSALGHLAEAAVAVQAPGGSAGTRLTNREKHEIFEAVVKIEEHAETLKRMLEE